jgi:hypothetical protein
VPDSRFKPDAPCNLSWWRGGAAAIAKPANVLLHN